MKENTGTKKKTLTAIAILLVLVLALGGTIAWLTSTSKLNNTFTVGAINPVDPGGKGPDGTDPDGDGKIPTDAQDKEKLNGNLYEPSWIKDSKLVPSAEIKKDPYVGIGAGSEDCYVYVYVKNTMNNNDHVYFDINIQNWEAIETVKTIDGVHYKGGLFRYKHILKNVGADNTWTATPLFDKIQVSKDAVAADFENSDGSKGSDGKPNIGSIQVVAYIHQAKDAQQKDLKDASETAAKDAAQKGFK